jgi:hypothetical protein
MRFVFVPGDGPKATGIMFAVRKNLHQNESNATNRGANSKDDFSILSIVNGTKSRRDGNSIFKIVNDRKFFVTKFKGNTLASETDKRMGVERERNL